MIRITLTIFLLFFVSLGFCQAEEDPFDVQLGEKLFKDDRFSQGFFVNSKGQMNAKVIQGDPILETLNTTYGPIPHPLRGQQQSCAACHLVDQAVSEKYPDLGFAYNDFAERTLVPVRGDGHLTALRNSMNMVLSNLEENKPLHWDGEFFSGAALTCATLVGRNMGWRPEEEDLAKQHIVSVVRKDDGSYKIDSDIEGSYSEAFQKLGVDLASLSDDKLRSKVCETITTYMKSLDFSRDSQGAFNGSGYDQFLKLNGIRRQPKVGESKAEYLQYLRDHINYKEDWKFVEPSTLQYHNHPSQFGKTELLGMKIFFTRGQCASCHQPPEFTDFNFHNTGISQIEYDKVHGGGAFAKLKVPTWQEREKYREQYLVPTGEHPLWKGLFAKVPSLEQPLAADLGVWNIFGHPDKAKVQPLLKENICESARHPDCSNWSNQDYLDYALGAFKTTTLRDLGQTAPYFHDGSGRDLTHTLRVYFAASHMARDGRLVNADPMLKAMHMMPHDFPALEAFLEALDEDYD